MWHHNTVFADLWTYTEADFHHGMGDTLHLENPWLDLTPDNKDDDPIEYTDMVDPVWAAPHGKCMNGRIDASGHTIHPFIKFRKPIHSVHVVLEDKTFPNVKSKLWDAYFEGTVGDPGTVSLLQKTGKPYAGSKKAFPDFCPPFTKDTKYSLCVTDTDKNTFNACYTLAPTKRAPGRHLPPPVGAKCTTDAHCDAATQKCEGTKCVAKKTDAIFKLVDAFGNEDNWDNMPRAPTLLGFSSSVPIEAPNRTIF
eukprot:GEMP01060057.1.p1 GENE.GEMP01060057.1~~GEMP01060057.1.p1  ORF type:complete len:252 (+),score=47.84 GEMP01060057.1:295-1050(+)